MARTSVTTTPIVQAGVPMTLTAADVVNGEVIDTGRVVLIVTNSGGSAATVTIHSTVVVDGLTLSNRVVSVAAGATEVIGPLSASTFGQATSSSDSGRAYVDYSAAVNREVFSL